eukprot:732815-Pelagomonas_calceolata.AAC.1
MWKGSLASGSAMSFVSVRAAEHAQAWFLMRIGLRVRLEIWKRQDAIGRNSFFQVFDARCWRLRSGMAGFGGSTGSQ